MADGIFRNNYWWAFLLFLILVLLVLSIPR